MLAWLRSPRGSISTATAVAVVLAALWFMQRAPLHDIGPIASGPTSADQQPAASGTPGVSAPAPVQPAQPPAANPPAKQAATGGSQDEKASPTGTSQAKQETATSKAEPPAAAVIDEPKPAASSAGTAQSPASQRQAAAEPKAALPSSRPALPTFDIVRVEPSGDAVVAGRAEPGSSLDLVDDGTVVAHVTVDGSGQFALLPPRLGEGSHYLTLQTGTTGASRVISAQSVAVSVAKNGAERPLVALMSPDQPVRVLSDGAPAMSAPQPAAMAAKANVPATPVAIQTVEAAQGGQFTASGVARAGSQCRLYLNGAFLADVTTGQDGRWSVRIEKGMRPGKYTVRADEIEASSGKVVNRAEVPFDYPAVAELGAGSKRTLVSHLGKPVTPVPAPAAPEPPLPASSPPQPVVAAAVVRPAPGPQIADAATALAPSPDPQAMAAVVVPDLQTAKVIRGDSLWRISRKMLGHGVNYTEIYASNASQIRDPRLIYPGQIFVVPNHAVN